MTMTLERAELLLRRKGLVENELVDASFLLKECGYSLANIRQSMKRIIEAHKLQEPRDYRRVRSQTGMGRPTLDYYFTINTASHVLLSALTREGKAARQYAIDFINKSPEELLEYVATLVEDLDVKNKIIETKDSMIQSLDTQLKDALSYLTGGVTIHEFARSLPGVNSMMLSRYLQFKGWLRGNPLAWKTVHTVRDKYLRELVVDTRNGPRVKILLTDEGARIIMNEYRAGKLPMRKGR